VLLWASVQGSCFSKGLGFGLWRSRSCRVGLHEARDLSKVSGPVSLFYLAYWRVRLVRAAKIILMAQESRENVIGTIENTRKMLAFLETLKDPSKTAQGLIRQYRAEVEAYDYSGRKPAETESSGFMGQAVDRPSWAPRHYGDEGYPDPYARGSNGQWLNP
jgi:hypothetical protein